MSLEPVPKPSGAGKGKAAIADTKASYANVRTGPSTDYEDIGDVRDKTLVTYYPASNKDGWVWVEQFSTAGWIATSVVNFNEVDVEPPKDFPPTPYDGMISVWHWKGRAIPESTITEFVSNLKSSAPNVGGVFVKIGDGNSWQGKWDDGDMAVNGPDDVARWVQTLGSNDLTFHAWMVVKGTDIDGESDIIIKTCNTQGVKSFILDVEPYDGYWEAGPEAVSQLMNKVRSAIPDGFHIGIAVDPRRAHYKSIHPDEWFPFVDSVHTMSYWRTFRRTVEDTLRETYRVWGGFGKPLYPILQGRADTLQEQMEAVATATTVYNAKGLSWWRYGVISQWDAINIPIKPPKNDGDNPSKSPPPQTVFGKEVIIFPGQDGYRSGTYTQNDEFKKFKGAFGWDSFYTTTEPNTSKVWAEWRTALPEDGTYQIAVFIPARHSTTKKARYKIHGIRGTNTEVIVDINQSIYRNEWVPLGVFDLVKNQQNAGKVFLNDVTGESGEEIAFDALRYRQIIRLENGEPANGESVRVADGYDPPVGSKEERAGKINTDSNFWFGKWRDATGFAEDTSPSYVNSQGAYHTGVDLNWQYGNSDQGKPVYAPASGEVIFQSEMKFWGNVTVIRHDPLYAPTGPVYYTRYGHMQNVSVKVGDYVQRGDQIGEIGTGNGRFWAHLHYDVVRTAIMETKPSDWPRMDLQRLKRDYVDPLKFTVNHRPNR